MGEPEYEAMWPLVNEGVLTDGDAAPRVRTMRTSPRLVRLAILGLGSIVFGSGCASAVDPKLVFGTYGVQVSAFGKTDEAVVIASQGVDDVILLNFTYGFTTDYDAPNRTGLRATLEDGKLTLAQQPVHVDHSTGEIDGMMTGVGTTGGASVSLTLKVVPSNVILKDESGAPLPAGSTIDYEVEGPKQ